MRLLVDTNVLLDCFLRREPFYEWWLSLDTMRYFGDAELWVSAKSFTDVYYIAARRADGHAVQQAISNLLAMIRVCSIDGDDVAWAAEQKWDDFEDCLVSRAAEKVSADYIISRNCPDFQRSSVPAIEPDRFLSLVEEKYGVTYEEASF